MMVIRLSSVAMCLLLAACGDEQDQSSSADLSSPPSTPQVHYDVIVRNGTVYDGTGAAPEKWDLAINGERIAAIGDLAHAAGDIEVDASGQAVSPGFVNMLSWAPAALIEDGRALSDVKQGVTLEIFGEGGSMGPMSESARPFSGEFFGHDYSDQMVWTTLGEYLDWITAKGISPNVASFVGATTIRINHIGFDDRPPTAQELERMRADVALAMEEGAMGLGSSLIYAPAFYADTAELLALSEIVGRYGGVYTSHMRSEGARLLEGVDELIQIARETGVGGNIYHLKAAGSANWDKMEQVFAKVEAARAEGLQITADMYPYIAGATELASALPPWVHEGGRDALMARIKDFETRSRIISEMKTPTDEWEQLLIGAGGGEGVLILGLYSEKLKPLVGKSLSEVAAARGTGVEETILDLIIEDQSGGMAAYFMMSEDNLRKQLQQPWVSIDSDMEASAPEGIFLERSTHPRAYGTFARVLAKYVREAGVLTLEEAIRRMTSLPMDNLHIADRGRLREGAYADIVVFDPAAIQDHATFDEPYQFSTGVDHVFINGVHILKGGEHTGATAGQVVRGPGFVEKMVTVVFETDLGNVEIKVYPGNAPISVANFLAYVDGGYFDNASIYRTAKRSDQAGEGGIEIVQGGMIGTRYAEAFASGDVSRLTLESALPPIEHETTDKTGLKNEYGVISWGRLDLGTATSEFFINMGANPSLDTGDASGNTDGQGYATFGRVSRGMEYLEQAQDRATGEGGLAQVMNEPVAIKRAYRK